MSRDALGRRLLSELAHLRLASGSDLSGRLGISQATFSRLTTSMADKLLAVGRGRARRYAARRSIPDLGDQVPVYQVGVDAKARKVAVIHPVLPEAFYVEALSEDYTSRLHDDLPYFLNDIRPSGFLGRLVPSQHPELEAPSDVRNWSGTQVLRYLGRFGWNLSGDLIVGDEAYERYVRQAGDPPDRVEFRRRARRYPERAANALESPPGSSAGGEQPKFLAFLVPGPGPVIVKFSALMTSALGRRQADLLVSEHVAHEVLRKHGMKAARSSVLLAEGRTFLELERFDRDSSGGRRGLTSMLALDAEYVGSLRTWTESAAGLAKLGIIDQAMRSDAAWLDLFGRLIANNDRHGANLSFFVRGERVLSVAPAYDMHPASYAGQSGNLAYRPFDPPSPSPSDAAVWDQASLAALDFWHRVAAHRMVSRGFRGISARNAERVVAYRKTAERLPAAEGTTP